MEKILQLDLATFSDELKLLIAVIRRDTKLEAAVYDSYADINWDLFLQLAYHHKVYSLLYHNIQKYQLNMIPEHVVSSLHLAYSQNTFLMLSLSGQIIKICTELNKLNIRAIALKGPALAEVLYGDISLRTSKDLDILISIDDVEKSEALLLQMGYIIYEERPRIFTDWKYRDHHQAYYHPEQNNEIELHWRLNPDTGSEPSFDDLWNRRASSSFFKNCPVYTLGNEDLLYYLASHGARHGWFRLRWLVDIDRLVHRLPESDMGSGVILKYHAAQMVGQALILSSNLFHTLVPFQLIPLTSMKHSQRLANAALNYICETLELCSEPSESSVSKQFQKYIYSLLSTSQKIKYHFRRLQPRSIDAKFMPLPRALFFLYYPMRPIIWIWRRRKQRALQ